MGQSSSQPALTQNAEAVVKSQDSYDKSDGSESAAEDEIVVASTQDPAKAATESTRKRSRSIDGEEGATTVTSKKRKTGSEEPSMRRKRSSTNRSVPQHRRGTAIRPSQDPTTVNAIGSSSGSNGGEDGKADEIAVDAASTSKNVEPGTIQNGVVKDSQDLGKNLQDADIDSDYVRKDGGTVNPVGKPGPRKRKPKPVQAAQSKEHEEENDSAHESIASNIDVGAVVNPIGQPGPRKRKSALASKINATVNPIGRPGPPRRKKQKRRRGEDEQQAIAGAEDSSRAAPHADRIPTPPESPDDAQDGDEAGQGEVHDDGAGDDDVGDGGLRDGEVDDNAIDNGDEDGEGQRHNRTTRRKRAKRVSNWLARQNTPAHPELPPSNHGSPVQERKTSKRGRDANDTVEDGDDDGDEYIEDQRSESEEENQPKKRKNSKKAEAAANLPTQPENKLVHPDEKASRGTVKGAWSEEEKLIADKIFHSACRQKGISESQMKVEVNNFDNTGPFKEDMFKAFPLRTTVAIRKFCKRRYNHRNTGAWTPEQDQLLRQAYVEHPDQWEDIANSVERSAADCRKRWYNTLVFGDTMIKGPWSQEEEDYLVKVVEETLDTLRKDCDDPEILADRKKLESLISWNKVAEKNGRTRPAHRCREKWYSIKKRHETGPRGIVDTSSVPSATNNNQHSKRKKAAETQYAKLGWGDVHDAVGEIHKAVSEHDVQQNYPHESTFWSILAIKTPNSKFNSAVRRRAYEGALERFGNYKKVKRAEGIGGKARRIWKLMSHLARQGEIELEYKYSGSQAKNSRSRTPITPKVVVESDDKLQASVAAQTQDNVAEEPSTPQEIPETQETPAPDNNAEGEVEEQQSEIIDDIPMSSINSRYAPSLRSETPQLMPLLFVDRCRAAMLTERNAQGRAGGRMEVDAVGRVVRTP